MTVSSSALLLPILLLSLLPLASFIGGSILFTVCSGSNYTSSGTYASSLNRLLTIVSVSVSKQPSLFATAVSEDTSNLFAMAQCRPDVIAQLCAFCIQDSINTITNSSSNGCSLRRSGAIRYDYCVIRYSDQPFFGSGNNDEKWRYFFNTDTTSTPSVFKEKAKALMSDVVSEAAEATLRFAVRENISEESQEYFIYGMAWCTMDLSTWACSMCLHEGFKGLFFERLGGQVVGLDCALRFENWRFYQQITPPPASELPDLTGLTSNHGESSNVHHNRKSASLRRTVLRTIVILAAALVLC